MKKLSVIILSLLLILLFNFCDDNKSQSSIDKINFNVDTSLLAEKVFVKNSLISIMPPKNWQMIDSDSTKAIINTFKFHNEQSPIILTPENIFIDSITQSILIVSLISNKSNQAENKFISDYKQQIKNTSADSKVMINEFYKDLFHITQFLIQNKDYINFKLIVDYKNSLLQLDFYIPPKEYTTEIAKTIESSIGSMNVLNNKSNKEDL